MCVSVCLFGITLVLCWIAIRTEILSREWSRRSRVHEVSTRAHTKFTKASLRSDNILTCYILYIYIYVHHYTIEYRFFSFTVDSRWPMSQCYYCCVMVIYKKREKKRKRERKREKWKDHTNTFQQQQQQQNEQPLNVNYIYTSYIYIVHAYRNYNVNYMIMSWWVYILVH